MFLLFVSIVLCSSCGDSRYQPLESDVTYATSDPITQEQTRVLRVFLIGMKENDANALKSVVKSDAGPKVDAWIAEHEPVMCKPDLLNEEQSFGVIDVDSGTRWVARWYYSLSCPGQNPDRAVYSLEFEDLEMHAQNQTWVVVDWAAITEVWE